MRITGKTRIYGLVGYPVEHSLSPAMQNAAFSYHKMDAAYLPFLVEPRNLKEAITGLAASGVGGLNITIPHKEAALAVADDADDAACAIGAVNTILVKGKRLYGFNTDAPGFLRAIKEELNFIPKGKDVLVLGAGGAGRAVVYALACAGAGFIMLHDVDGNKAKRLTARVDKIFKRGIVCPVSDLEKINFKKFDLLVNASPVGMEKGSPIDTSLLNSKLSVYDLVYNRKTELVEAAQRRGGRAANGLGMLLHQGALSFKIWTKKSPPLKIMRSALADGIRKL